MPNDPNDARSTATAVVQSGNRNKLSHKGHTIGVRSNLEERSWRAGAPEMTGYRRRASCGGPSPLKE